MFLTTLIKNSEYKNFLLKAYPKPSDYLKQRKAPNNLSPSLTGNSFELLFKLKSSKSSNSKRILSEELNKAFNNIKFRQLGNNAIKIQKEGLFILVPNEDYKRILFIIKNESINLKLTTLKYSKGTLKYIEFIKPFFIEICNIQEKIKLKNLSSYAFHYRGKSIYIINTDSLTLFNEKIISRFRIFANEFLLTRKLTSKFVLLLMQFSHLYSTFYKLSDPLKNTSIEGSYLKNTFQHFNSFNKVFVIPRGRIIHKPYLELNGIIARPDLIIGKKIYELKTSKIFFSQNDYLQALSYLLFFQEKDNIEIFGQINIVVLYYSLYNKAIEIDIRKIGYSKNTLVNVKEIIRRFKKGFINKK